MDDQDDKQSQIVFANLVLDQYIDHLLGGKDVGSADYIVMRVSFRRLGGLWSEVLSGNVPHILLLAEVVRAWGNQKKAK